MHTDSLKYNYHFDPEGDSVAARLLRLVGSNKRVLELGCAGGSMSKVLAQKYECDVVGVELDSVAAESAKKFCSHVLVADIESSNWEAALEGCVFDVILIADVLEHLHAPNRCLERVIRFLDPEGGRLVLSVPNIAHNGVVAALLQGEFPYREVGLLDKTHIYHFTGRSLARMLEETGYRITSFDFVCAGPDHPEFARFWGNMPSALVYLLETNPEGCPYQYIVSAEPELACNKKGAFSQAVYKKEMWMSGLEHALFFSHKFQFVAHKNNAELEQKNIEIEQLKARIKAFEDSKSWKLTKPLRDIKRFLKA